MLIAKRIYGIRSLQVAIGIVAAVGLYWLWLGVFAYWRQNGEINWRRYSVYCLVMVLSLVIDFFRASRWMPPRADGFSERYHAWFMTVKQVATVTIVLMVFFFLAKDMVISRIFLVAFVPALFVVLYLLNCTLPFWLTARLFRGRRKQRTLIVGTSESIRQLHPWILKKASYGIDPVGVLLEDMKDVGTICGMRCFGTMEALSAVLNRESVSLLIHANLPRYSKDLEGIRAVCDAVGTRLMVACDLGEELAKTAKFMSDGGVHLLSFRDEPLESPSNRLLKRGLNVAVSLLVVIFILPITSLLVWILQKWQSPGPLLFQQVRTGHHNEEFIIYKYRTMHVDNPEPNRQATEDDPRIYSAGRWLRRSSLDEFPQFINVLLGEMSVVGPRPHVPAHDEQFSSCDARYRVRQMVKPGITGLAQIRGQRGESRNDAAVHDRTKSDLHYVENWSFQLDILIIFRTVLHILRAPDTAR